MPSHHPTLLIFSSANDDHVQKVMQHLTDNTLVLICDFSLFSKECCASILFSDPPCIAIHNQNGEKFYLDRVDAVWWWRPTSFPLQDHLSKEVGEFLIEEYSHFWAGLMAILPHEIRWYNHFQHNLLATRKLFQLRLARECGMFIPETLVTSSPYEAARFIREHDRVVFKALFGTDQVWRPTQEMTDELLMKLDHVALCPVVFQEYIPGGEDYRVVIIDEFVQAVSFDTMYSRYPLDVSMDPATACRADVIPVSLLSALREFMRRSGLRYGAFDLRRKPDQEFVFLEINPAGQFLYLDLRAKTSVAKAMANALSCKNPSVSVMEESSDPVRINYDLDRPFLLCTPKWESKS
jgi:hypothetical protein